MPGGIFGSGRPLNLSYPYYIDGGFKIFGFNNIIWGNSIDPDDPYRSMTAGNFSVFGFLNHFTNNTIMRQGRALGGSSGERTDIISNVFAEISMQFLRNNRVENPSLVGGGDTMKRKDSYLKRFLFCVFALTLIVFSTTAFGATIRVPIDQPTIQSGIDAATDGDTVLVESGTYFENLVMSKDISLIG